MGYSTRFSGKFELDRPLTVAHLRKLEHLDDELLDGICQWVPTDDGTGIEWDGGEKFYDYIPWIEYIVATYLVPWGYVLNGSVRWSGEEVTDVGTIVVKDNVVKKVDGFSEADMVVVKVPRQLVEAFVYGDLDGDIIAELARVAAGL